MSARDAFKAAFRSRRIWVRRGDSESYDAMQAVAQPVWHAAFHAVYKPIDPLLFPVCVRRYSYQSGLRAVVRKAIRGAV